MYALKARNLSKSYRSSKGAVKVLSDVNLKIARGEMAAIMGPSGSGKTTLLHVLTGVDIPDSGKVEIGNRDFTGSTQEEAARFRREHMGMIFQDFQLLESLTVKENILLPLILSQRLSRQSPNGHASMSAWLVARGNKREASEQEEALEKVMGELGITELADKGMDELSGGQKQRVAIGRALINEPEIIFGDEPSGSLDRKTTGDVMKCMVQMNRKFGTTFLLVTHDVYAASFCDRVLLLQDGKLECEVKKQGSNAAFREDILKMWCHLGGEQDDIL
ncbi:MAG: ABC transporter ATP-binding protein [Eubacteriales bacterium]|nr:ABC transporter ATP-binding protein [Eubacteriales bacterium]